MFMGFNLFGNEITSQHTIRSTLARTWVNWNPVMTIRHVLHSSDICYRLLDGKFGITGWGMWRFPVVIVHMSKQISWSSVPAIHGHCMNTSVVIVVITGHHSDHRLWSALIALAAALIQIDREQHVGPRGRVAVVGLTWKWMVGMVVWSMANSQRSVPNILITGECLYVHFANNINDTLP
jgi:hypothetical protein